LKHYYLLVLTYSDRIVLVTEDEAQVILDAGPAGFLPEGLRRLQELQDAGHRPRLRYFSDWKGMVEWFGGEEYLSLSHPAHLPYE
jgi:hypothetical protein